MLAPGSDIDLLFLLPDKPTPASREGRRGAALRALGPQAEGRPRHAHGRRMPEAGARRHDDPHHAVEARFVTGDKALFETLQARFDKEIVAKTAPEFVAAKLAEREEPRPAGRRVALPRRAQRQGGQGRPARPQHALLDLQIRLPRSQRARPHRGRASFRPANSRCFAAARNFCGRCAAGCISSPGGPKSV